MAADEQVVEGTSGASSQKLRSCQVPAGDTGMQMAMQMVEACGRQDPNYRGSTLRKVFNSKCTSFIR